MCYMKLCSNEEHNPLYKRPWNITETDFILGYKEIYTNFPTKQKLWGPHFLFTAQMN